MDTALTPSCPYLLAAESDDNRDDMRRFLANAAAWPGISQALQQSGYTSEQFVATLLEKCRGVWIYLRYVVQEIERGERSPLALDALPEGIAQYYAAYWQRWRVQANGEQRSINPQWHQIYRPVLAMMAASQEPCTVEQLAAWTRAPISLEELRWLCNEQWRPFLAITGKGQQTRYRFYHATLQEFFEGRLAPERSAPYTDLVNEVAEATLSAHSHLADRYLALWGGLEAHLPGLQDAELRNRDEGYGLRHLAAHLAALGDAFRLNALLCIEWEHSRVDAYTRRGWRKHLDKLLGRQPMQSTPWYENAWFAAKEAPARVTAILPMSRVCGAWLRCKLLCTCCQLSQIALKQHPYSPTQSHFNVAVRSSLLRSTALPKIFRPACWRN